MESKIEHGGDLVAKVLKANGVDYVFTLVGGHISPILVGARKIGIEVIDTRHEASAVFAADVMFRLTGTPGIAAVTAGPGVTNTITALKNAQMAESAVILLGGASPTILEGRGSLQDIDQLSVIHSLVKWQTSVKKVRDIIPVLQKAFEKCQQGVPGPVFVELPLDVIYPEEIVRPQYGIRENPRGLVQKLVNWYVKRHANRVFGNKFEELSVQRYVKSPFKVVDNSVLEIKNLIGESQRPVLLVGSQAVLDSKGIIALQQAVIDLNIPTFLSGMARGLLGRNHPLHIRHKRTNALKSADLVILAGVPTDFRLNYGRQIKRGTKLVSINHNKKTLKLNKMLRAIDHKIYTDPGYFLKQLSSTGISASCETWYAELKSAHDNRNEEIKQQGDKKLELVNPIRLCLGLEDYIDDNSVLIGDGGDFVATASYIVQPRSPLRWLDPGVFGTLGPGGGFAIASQLIHKDAEVWLLYGDGSSGYSLAEFDSFVRHKLPIIAIVGNDASWQQIARDQVEYFDDDVAVNLAYTDYHKVAEGFGAKGILVKTDEEIIPALIQAKKWSKAGHPVLVNVLIDKTDFRKGSIAV